MSANYKFSTGCFTSFLTALKTDFADGVIYGYQGTMPSSPDDVPGGTLIGIATVDGGAWAAGSPTNGLEFDAPSGASISKAAAETWKFVCTTPGTVNWLRFVSNSASDTGQSSTTLKRMDMTAGVNSGLARMGRVTFDTIPSAPDTAGQFTTIDVYTIPLVN